MKRALESPATEAAKRIKPAPAIRSLSCASVQWPSGSEQQLTWSSSGDVPKVDVDLRKPGRYGGSYVKTLLRSVDNQGACTVAVPTGLTPSEYTVRVESAANRAVFADSEIITITCSGPPPAISDVATRQSHGPWPG